MDDEFMRLMELERMLMWRSVSPMSNLHTTSCNADCLKPSHYPNSDPLNEDEDDGQ